MGISLNDLLSKYYDNSVKFYEYTIDTQKIVLFG